MGSTAPTTATGAPGRDKLALVTRVVRQAPQVWRSFGVALILATLATLSVRAVLSAMRNLNLRGPVVAPLRGPHASPVTPPRRVLAILVDGLRADVAEEQPFLALLAAGATADLHADPPTFSAAQYVALLTGVAPRDSGVRTNVGLRRTPLDDVPARLRAAGRRAVEVGDEVDWWGRLFGDDFSSARLVRSGDLVVASLAAMPGADLLLVHINGVDQAGHRYGAGSRAYADAARAADAQVRALALAWGWPFRPVVVFNDHGHAWPRGGHGGEEPDVSRTWLFGSGPGLRQGGRVTGGRAVDVAPTLAALAGVPSPAQAEGHVLLGILDLDDVQRLALLGADGARIIGTLPAVAMGRAAHAAAEDRGQTRRFITALMLLAILWSAARSRARGRELGGLGAGLLAFALTAAGYWLIYGKLSLSADRLGSLLATRTCILAALAGLVALTPAMTRVFANTASLVDTEAFLLRFTLGAAPLAVAVFIAAGGFAPRFTCEPAWLAAAPMIVYAGFAGITTAASGLLAMAMVAAALRTARARGQVRLPRPDDQLAEDGLDLLGEAARKSGVFFRD